VHGDEETLAFDDMKLAFGDEEEASAAFTSKILSKQSTV
jgi:hypothetical protein